MSNENNVFDFVSFAKKKKEADDKKKKKGMSEEEFYEKYMKDSLCSLYSSSAIALLNNHPKKD